MNALGRAGADGTPDEEFARVRRDLSPDRTPFLNVAGNRHSKQRRYSP
jgi:hypothetical protein